MNRSKLTGFLILLGIGILLTVGIVQIADNAGRPRDSRQSGSVEEIRTPLQASATVHQRGGRIIFGQDLRDAEGNQIYILPHRPPAPRVEVFDSAGEKVHSGKLEYG